MDAKSLLDATTAEDSLSALSTQLVSLGYLSRPLDLSTLFLSPALPSNPSSKALKRHHDLLVLQARAREQIAKCLWGMLDQRQSERDVMEGLLAGEARAAEDAERERKARERTEREREAIARDLEAERAKSKCVPPVCPVFAVPLTSNGTQGARNQAQDGAGAPPSRAGRARQDEERAAVRQDAGRGQSTLHARAESFRLGLC